MMNKKLYHVELTYHAVVVAEDETEAYFLAKNEAREITRDACDPDDVEVVRQITSESDLSDVGEWGPDCYPYRDFHGPEKTIAEILAENANG